MLRDSHLDDVDIDMLVTEDTPTLSSLTKDEGLSPLMSAGFEGSVEVVKLLLEHGADANLKSCNPAVRVAQAQAAAALPTATTPPPPPPAPPPSRAPCFSY